jgi:Dolichyl-phosphate-mannose-protein mannosyltransferase
MLRYAAALPARALELPRVVPDWLLVAVAALVALLPQFTRSGPEMDEGLVLSYADRLLHGAIPYRDFPYYGPANLWSVAGAFAIFGVRLDVERAVGLFYIVASIVGIYLLVRRASFHAAVASVVLTVALAMRIGVWAYVTRPAVAFLVWSILLATSREHATSRRDRLLFALAGFLAGCSLLCRFDFVLVAIPAAIVLVRRMDRTARRWYLASLAAALPLYLPYLVLSGRVGIARGMREFAASGAKRVLPLPSPLVFPQGALLFGSALALCVIGAVAVVLWRRSAHAVALGAVAAAAAGAIPLTLSRADETHISAIALLIFGVLPLAAVEIATHLRSTSAWSRLLRAATALSVVWGVAALVAVGLLADTASIIRGSVYRGAVVKSEGRTFILASKRDAAQAQQVLSAVDRVAHRGQSVFVGPTDLRRAEYGPTYMYYLLPQLRPASYYTVINPGVVNAPDSTLAHDLLRANWLILVSKWDKIREPYAGPLGPAAPNDVVRTKFCLRVRVGAYRLYASRGLASDSGACAEPAVPASH